MGNGASWPDGLYNSEVLVALDDGERGGSLHFRAGVLDVSPRKVCLSVPQIPEAIILRRTAPGSRSVGSG